MKETVFIRDGINTCCVHIIMPSLQTWKNNGLVHPAETILNEIHTSETHQKLLRNICSWIKMNKHADRSRESCTFLFSCPYLYTEQALHRYVFIASTFHTIMSFQIFHIRKKKMIVKK